LGKLVEKWTLPDCNVRHLAWMVCSGLVQKVENSTAPDASEVRDALVALRERIHSANRQRHAARQQPAVGQTDAEVCAFFFPATRVMVELGVVTLTVA
jgi:hypothetical protein